MRAELHFPGGTFGIRLSSKLGGKKVNQMAHGRQQSAPGREHRVDNAAARQPAGKHLHQTTLQQILPHLNLWQLHDAGTEKCGVMQGGQIGRDEPRLMVDFEPAPVSPFKGPTVFAHRWPKIQTG